MPILVAAGFALSREGAMTQRVHRASLSGDASDPQVSECFNDQRSPHASALNPRIGIEAESAHMIAAGIGSAP